MDNKHVEERGYHGNALYRATSNYTGGAEMMTTGLERITQLVREHPDRKLQTLIHMVNAETLRGVHNRQDKNKAYGVDKVTKAEYEENIEDNIKDLLARMKQFSYRPQPVRRVYIPKDGSEEMRPLGVLAYEDKLVQGAMADILSAVYEPKFYEFSYGYRENRGCHQALEALDGKLWNWTEWVVDADIHHFFDTVDHEWLMRFLEHDIEDRNFLRYVKRFLKAGIMEEGKYYDVDMGVPQGGLISPVLSNVYLHYVIDMWFAEAVTKACKGRAEMIRVADDVVFCFEYERDAVGFYGALRDRLKKFNLELSEEKSQIVRFGRNAGEDAGKFDFLGFTHSTGKSRKGTFCVKRRTSQKKLKAKRMAVKKWIRENMHTNIKVLIDKLNRKLRGHYNYYGIIGNYKAMHGFREYVLDRLKATLNRRGAKKDMTDETFRKLLRAYPVVQPRIVHRV
jgi:group II intron reverse transcriptase/maturase